jgi:hypothetical protein
VHTNFYIHDNLFIGNGNCGLFAASVKGLRLENNRFAHNAVTRFDSVSPYTAFDVGLKSCDEVTIDGNTTDRPDSFLYLDRCGDASLARLPTKIGAKLCQHSNSQPLEQARGRIAHAKGAAKLAQPDQHGLNKQQRPASQHENARPL